MRKLENVMKEIYLFLVIASCIGCQKSENILNANNFESQSEVFVNTGAADLHMLTEVNTIQEGTEGLNDGIRDIIFSFSNNYEIDNYLSCTIETTSIRNEETITPSYRFLLAKKKNNLIKELSIEIIYHYGQNLTYLNRKMFVLNEIEIRTLNLESQIVMSYILPEMERESQIVLENSVGYLDPDGEYIVYVFYRLVVEE